MLWPDASALKLFEMTLTFAERANGMVSDARQQLASDAKELLGKDFDGELLVSAALEAQAIYNQATEEDRWTDALFDRILRAIQTRLSLESLDQARMLWGLLGAFSETTEDGQVTVILACTFLERLLGDVLTVLGITSGLTYSQAERRMEKCQSIDQRKAFFHDMTRLHVTMDNAFQSLGYGAFWSDWNTIRKRRNDFVHGLPWAIGEETTRLAVKTSKQAVPALAQLQNTYCIR
ncbi:MAG TPA: hypothetical protein VJR48_12745 [Ktedonobacterales bacterium]|nr:hypothetical protein [Ktedonobacterales bacterium]